MANNQNLEKDVFRPYLEKRYSQAGALTHGQQCEVIREIIEEVKQGKIPVSPSETIKLGNPNSPIVKAVREGRKVALESSTDEVEEAEKPEAKQRRAGLIGVGLLLLFPILGLVWWFWPSGGGVEDQVVEVIAPVEEVIATATVLPTIDIVTMTPIPTIEPTVVPTVEVDDSEYEIVQPTVEAATYNTNPIALEMVGREFRVSMAEHQAKWEPVGVEWWPGTHVRRVFAVPYDETLLNSVFDEMDQPITIRLRTGASIQYEPSDIRRLTKFKIENLMASEPSIAIILYGEDSEERWLIIGRATQETISEGVQDVVLDEDEIDFLTIDSCNTVGMKMSCTIAVAESEAWQIEKITLTELEWLDGGVFPETTIENISKADSGFIYVQITGIVRNSGTAVISIKGDGQKAEIVPNDLINSN